MADEMIRGRRSLRPGWSSEDNGKGIKRLNRQIVRGRIKRADRKNWDKEI